MKILSVSQEFRRSLKVYLEVQVPRAISSRESNKRSTVRRRSNRFIRKIRLNSLLQINLSFNACLDTKKSSLEVASGMKAQRMLSHVSRTISMNVGFARVTSTQSFSGARVWLTSSTRSCQKTRQKRSGGRSIEILVSKKKKILSMKIQM